MFFFAEIEHKPDLVWPTSSHIVATAVSRCTSLVAVAVQSGIVTIWDKYIGSVYQETGAEILFHGTSLSFGYTKTFWFFEGSSY